MLCPFNAEEKQSLLECATLADRAKAMTGFCEARAGGNEPPPGTFRH